MSDYVLFEVTPAPAPKPPEPTAWSQVEWVDGPTLLGFEYVHAELLGAVPAKEMGR